MVGAARGNPCLKVLPENSALRQALLFGLDFHKVPPIANRALDGHLGTMFHTKLTAVSYQSSATGPEGRKMVAHGVSRGTPKETTITTSPGRGERRRPELRPYASHEHPSFSHAASCLTSYAPPGLVRRPRSTHGLRRGLRSFAATRLTGLPSFATTRSEPSWLHTFGVEPQSFTSGSATRRDKIRPESLNSDYRTRTMPG